jgi:hypothetical protein
MSNRRALKSRLQWNTWSITQHPRANVLSAKNPASVHRRVSSATLQCRLKRRVARASPARMHAARSCIEISTRSPFSLPVFCAAVCSLPLIHAAATAPDPAASVLISSPIATASPVAHASNCTPRHRIVVSANPPAQNVSGSAVTAPASEHTRVPIRRGTACRALAA